MKKKLALVILTLFSLMSLGGLFGLSLVKHSNHFECPVKIMATKDCSMLSGSLAMTLHHINEWGETSVGLVGVSWGLLLIVFFWKDTVGLVLVAMLLGCNECTREKLGLFKFKQQLNTWLYLVEGRHKDLFCRVSSLV